jgi:hypothetical protein
MRSFQSARRFRNRTGRGGIRWYEYEAMTDMYRTTLRFGIARSLMGRGIRRGWRAWTCGCEPMLQYDRRSVSNSVRCDVLFSRQTEPIGHIGVIQMRLACA